MHLPQLTTCNVREHYTKTFRYRIKRYSLMKLIIIFLLWSTDLTLIHATYAHLVTLYLFCWWLDSHNLFFYYSQPCIYTGEGWSHLTYALYSGQPSIYFLVHEIFIHATSILYFSQPCIYFLVHEISFTQPLHYILVIPVFISWWGPGTNPPS